MAAGKLTLPQDMPLIDSWKCASYCTPCALLSAPLPCLQAGVLAKSKLVVAKVALQSLLAAVALFNYAFASKKKGH